VRISYRFKMWGLSKTREGQLHKRRSPLPLYCPHRGGEGKVLHIAARMRKKGLKEAEGWRFKEKGLVGKPFSGRQRMQERKLTTSLRKRKFSSTSLAGESAKGPGELGEGSSRPASTGSQKPNARKGENPLLRIRAQKTS